MHDSGYGHRGTPLSRTFGEQGVGRVRAAGGIHTAHVMPNASTKKANKGRFRLGRILFLLAAVF